jgi:hypothetical protein
MEILRGMPLTWQQEILEEFDDAGKETGIHPSVELL